MVISTPKNYNEENGYLDNYKQKGIPARIRNGEVDRILLLTLRHSPLLPLTSTENTKRSPLSRDISDSTGNGRRSILRRGICTQTLRRRPSGRGRPCCSRSVRGDF